MPGFFIISSLSIYLETAKMLILLVLFLFCFSGWRCFQDSPCQAERNVPNIFRRTTEPCQNSSSTCESWEIFIYVFFSFFSVQYFWLFSIQTNKQFTVFRFVRDQSVTLYRTLDSHDKSSILSFKQSLFYYCDYSKKHDLFISTAVEGDPKAPFSLATTFR